jgi:porphobilinogen synthase
MSDKNLDHILQGGYFHKTLRQWQSVNTTVDPSNFIYPLFIHENDDALEDIPSLPNVKRLGLNHLKKHLDPIVEDNLKCVLLFGVIDNDKLKDETGSYADNPQSSVIRSIPKLRQWYPDLLIACDVCLCGNLFFYC